MPLEAIDEDCAAMFIGAIFTVTEKIKSEIMKQPKGSLFEPQRTQIHGIALAYSELAKKLLEEKTAKIVIDNLYFEFEKPLSEHLGFNMPGTPFLGIT